MCASCQRKWVVGQGLRISVEYLGALGGSAATAGREAPSVSTEPTAGRIVESGVDPLPRRPARLAGGRDGPSARSTLLKTRHDDWPGPTCSGQYLFALSHRLTRVIMIAGYRFTMYMHGLRGQLCQRGTSLRGRR